MKTAKHPGITSQANTDAPQFPPLESITRPTVDTAAAAFYLNRRPQTLRIYASRGSGPLRPIRIHGRLHWQTDDLRRLLGVHTFGPTGATQ